ncbi:MAG: nitroreductase family protein [Clostridia bacterium]|nr:nitroreductase family protein [Clostridia bacterium]
MQRDYINAKPVLDAMLERNSVRTFLDRPIPDEVLDHILDVSIQAASGGCLQAYSIIVIKDSERKKKLCEACGGQKFVETAAVDLVYCLDWHKYDIYNKMKKAPLVAHRAFSHFIITAQDIMCAAQSAETAAHLCGIGSCYVGTILGKADQMKEELNLPKYVYPMTVLSLGYQKNDGTPRRRHMSRDMMIFDEKYPELDENSLYEAFEEKLQGMRMPLPKKDPARSRMLDTMKKSLLTTYSEEETEAIIAEIIEKGEFNETQRRFGLHYAACNMVQNGRETIEDMRKCGIVIDD